MTPGKQAVMRGNLRHIIEVYIKGCTPGTDLNTHRLARQFSNGRRSVTASSVSQYIKEYSNLQRTGSCEWRVIGCQKTVRS
jgi:uncharacterized protein YhfF